MKKKIILILSMAALLVVVLAFSVSASSYINLSSLAYEDFERGDFSVVSNKIEHGEGCTVGEKEEFGLINFSAPGVLLYGFVNVEYWHTIFFQYDISSSETLIKKIGMLMDDNMLCACDFEFNNQLNSYFDYYYSAYQEWCDTLSYSAEDFSAELNNLFGGYCSYVGDGELTAEGFNSYVSTNATEEFNLLYASSGINTSYETLYNAAVSSSGSSSGGSSTSGSPNISDEELVDTGYNPTRCTVCVGSAQDNCPHWMAGYDKAFYDGLKSEHNKELLQEAYNQGFEFANSESLEITINNAKTEAVENHLNSAEYKQALETFKQQTLQEYCTSEEYEKTLQNAFESGKEAYYDSGYVDGKDDGYADGYLTGTVDFQSSQTYKDSLQNYYNAGYVDGSADSDSSGNEDNSIMVLLGVLLSIGVVVALLLFASKKSRKKR